MYNQQQQQQKKSSLGGDGCEVQRKKSAFHDRIRRKQIEGMFRESRVQWLRAEGEGMTGATVGGAVGGSGHIAKNSTAVSNTPQDTFPYYCPSIPCAPRSPAPTHFPTPQSLHLHLHSLLPALPALTPTLCLFLTDNPRLLPHSSLYFSQHLPLLLSSFTQCSISQFQHLTYLLQSLIIHTHDPHTRRTIVQNTLGYVIARTSQYLKTHKIMYREIVGNVLGYLLAVGGEIAVINNITLLMLMEMLRQLWTKQEAQLCSEAVIISNYIVALPSSGTDNYSILQLKSTFIHQMLKYPHIFRSISQYGCSIDHSVHQLQNLLRFLINFTYVMCESEAVLLIIEPMTMMIFCVLCQVGRGGGNVAILGLKLVNNLLVENCYAGQYLYDNLIIGKIIQLYGYQLIDAPACNNTNANTQHYPRVQQSICAQFLSTICSYISMLTVGDGRIFVGNLGRLMSERRLHLVLVGGLGVGDAEVLERVLEGLLGLYNYEIGEKEAERGRGREGDENNNSIDENRDSRQAVVLQSQVAIQLLKNIHKLQSLMNHHTQTPNNDNNNNRQDNNIIAMLEQLMQIAHACERELQVRQVKRNKQGQMFQEMYEGLGMKGSLIDRDSI